MLLNPVPQVFDSKELELFDAIRKVDDAKMGLLIREEGVNPFYIHEGLFICTSFKDQPMNMEQILEQYILGIAICINAGKYDEAIRQLTQVKESALKEVIVNYGPITPIKGPSYQNLLHHTLALGKDEVLEVVKTLLACGANPSAAIEADLYKSCSAEIKATIVASLSKFRKSKTELIPQLFRRELTGQKLSTDKLKKFRPMITAKKGTNVEVGQALKTAIREYNLEKVTQLLDEGFWSINDYLPDADASLQYTALDFEVRAISGENPATFAIIQLLLDYGADSEIIDGNGRTALANAIRQGQWHARTCLMLLQAGANPLNAMPLIGCLTWLTEMDAVFITEGPQVYYKFEKNYPWEIYHERVLNIHLFMPCICFATNCGIKAPEKYADVLVKILKYVIKDPELGTAKNIKALIDYGAIADASCTDYFGRTAHQIAAIADSTPKSAMDDRGIGSLLRPLATFDVSSGAGSIEVSITAVREP